MSSPAQVAICWDNGAYPCEPPYSPSEAYPEYPSGLPLSKENNCAYRAVRGALELLGSDREHFGEATWNPLGSLVRPGETVVLKPNLVRDYHETRPDQMDCVITHGSVIRAVLDYVAIALQGRGRIVIADAPQGESSFERIRGLTGLDAVLELYRGYGQLQIEVVDLRRERVKKIDGVIVGETALPGDPAGYTAVNLGGDSEFTAINDLCGKLYGSDYDREELARHHNAQVHEYLLSRTVLNADVLINLPKLKTHKKAGVTLSLKNMVGVNGNKNWLPHHREGVPANGGDQYASSSISERLEHHLLAVFKRQFPRLGRLRHRLAGLAKSLGRRAFGDTDHGRVRSGNWYGNDTAWRMVLDLNRAVLYADGDGRLETSRPKRCFSLVDGLVGGEGNGPLAPDPRPAGLVVAGNDFAAVDSVCARLMGFDYTRVPTLREAFKDHRYPLTTTEHDAIYCVSNDPECRGQLVEVTRKSLGFRPHFGWAGHVELSENSGL